jgi:hypothetical protein
MNANLVAASRDFTVYPSLETLSERRKEMCAEPEHMGHTWEPVFPLKIHRAACQALYICGRCQNFEWKTLSRQDFDTLLKEYK